MTIILKNKNICKEKNILSALLLSSTDGADCAIQARAKNVKTSNNFIVSIRKNFCFLSVFICMNGKLRTYVIFSFLY